MTETYVRVIAYARNGSVVETETCTEQQTEEVHDRLMSLPLVKTCMTVGPFIKGKSQ